jgi:hypothetical protein
MGKLRDLVSKLKTFTPDKQEKDLLKIVKDHENDIVELNQSQLFRGHDAEGRSLGRYNSEEYAELKRQLNPRNVVDLKLSGSFYEGMFMKSRGEVFPITIDSKDEKRDKLVQGDAYGENIFGLTEESKTELNKVVLREPITKYYRDMFKL